ncbi:2,3-dihydro-2,3-dihydroxybenzoate dehydrogenase [Ancylobacter sp. A5.8]|uniref:2,3-dihydro-2,3-dihydroxybenzoate dehydrogenase n=1 Tax=Ancylobacter gelatini TaxID=2919920 RepID=UPI001F4E2DAC|nr:2,3-dihydro-2,3-dihydroxybenzoate dehydrogenase [Ancylobacter gelatini]MCJ8145138.1 2,3-dihydro-2,3-dihydroxybenzoate dehydrogenase [Ancylobacter gelatini]
MRDNGITGRLAVVTGAGGGIGRAVVRLLAEEGARVVATDRPEALDGIEGAARVEPLDVRDSGAVDALVARIEAEEGPIDLAAYVAGVLSYVAVTALSDEEWDRVFDINAKGVFRVSRALARVMQPRGRGAMVTVSSNAAGIPRHAMAAYAASKAAATMFTRCLGLELAPHGIRCNIVAPGSTLTAMQTGMWADENGAARVIAGSLPDFKSGIPLGKLASPEDVAEAAVFLLSARAGHITMTDLYVDGGATLRA